MRRRCIHSPEPAPTRGCPPPTPGLASSWRRFVIPFVLVLIACHPKVLLAADPWQKAPGSTPGAASADIGSPPGRPFQPTALRSESLRGQILPRDHTTLATELPARILRIHVAEGGRFKAGETLVTLDCGIQQAQLRKARAARTAAEKIASVNAKLAEMNSMGTLEVATSAAEAAKARAEESLWAATVDKCSLAAPFPGRVAEQKGREHQYLQAGQPVLDILDDSRLEVEFIAPSSWLSWIKPGLEFVLHADETGMEHPARIIRLGARVDPVSQSIKITGQLTGGTDGLLVGMSGRIAITPPHASGLDHTTPGPSTPP
ncbi:MAG: efflux RND transporter periplasmic adaptor subunit [Magnetococcales bacterium]|nr:efflux RND transporter periplasmic adaptor subunit [Magnetococcales bacterium]MBF0148942.1 efflux RND transporter periplasmic adaptor subunit [Magnetococcales bacterium]